MSRRQDVAKADARNGLTCAYGADLRDRLGSGKIRTAVGASDDLDRPPVIRCRGNDHYPYTAVHRGAAQRPPGHSVGKQCRENYVA